MYSKLSINFAMESHGILCYRKGTTVDLDGIRYGRKTLEGISHIQSGKSA